MTTESRVESMLARWDHDPQAARAALIEHSQGRLHELAHRMLRRDFPRVGRLEETDDVLQGAALRLLRALEAVRPDSAAGFFRLAATKIRQELLDLARRHFGPHGLGRRQQPLLAGADSADGSAPELAGGSSGAPEELARWTEMHARAARLPDEQRAVVDLMYYHGMTRQEAATALGLSESTIKRRWLAARVVLGSCLTD
jgi:RNA polymerase sigma-70 factor (ECF subfamily)